MLIRVVHMIEGMWACHGLNLVVSAKLRTGEALVLQNFNLSFTEDVNNLVDPASSHMLVSEIKPCMSKYIPSNGETANGSLNQLWFLRSYTTTWITVVILELIHATMP